MDDRAAILAIGDVHLGTKCSGVPDVVSSWGIHLEELTPAAALELSVDLAIEQKVDAVLFAGDVVESTNARFEAMPPLEASARRLLGAGIEVIAVAGNHDVEALPRLASLLDGFTLLGAGGRWESSPTSATRGQNAHNPLISGSRKPKVGTTRPRAEGEDKGDSDADSRRGLGR